MTPEEIKKLTEELKQQAEYQRLVSQSFDDYLKGVREYKKIQETLKKNKDLELKIENELLKARKRTDASAAKDVAVAEAKLKILREQTDEIETQGKALNNALSSVNKKSLIASNLLSSTAIGLGNAAKGLGKSFNNLPNLIQKGFGRLKGFGLFEMEKDIKNSALSMGVLSKQSNGFRTTIVNAAKETNMIGVGIKELALMQSSYSEELGRTVILSKEGLVAMGQMVAATGLGAEGAAKMTAEMETQGLTAERTAGYVEQTMNDAHKMGLNATKVLKNIQNNIKMLNKYNFKDGVKGLAKMSELVTKLGVSMEFASSFADKMWNVEGAVDMSAQLQVMGGEWSKMADPFRLMYMARNDMAGLTEEIGNAAASSAKFNARTGEFELGALEMHRLKVIAEQTGISYDELATAGKNAAKFTKIKSQIGFSMSKEEQEFLTNTAKIDENGKAYIEVDGNPKFLSQLTSSDKSIIKKQMNEKQSLKERAEQARTFDEQIVNLINQLKIYLLPIVKQMNDKLIPKIDGLVKRFTDNGWLGKIEGFADKIGGLISAIGGFILDNPITSALGYLGTKLLGKAVWFLNGKILGMGFNSVASVGGGGLLDSLPGGKATRVGGKLMRAGKYGKGLGLLGKGMAGAGVLSAGIEGYGEWSENSEMGMDFSENAGRTASKAAGAGLGAWGGATAGAAMGSLAGPIGTLVGGLIGGAIGAWGGGAAGEAGGDAIYGQERGINDGIISGSKSLGSDFSKGRGLIHGGGITPIDNKDDLLAMKPGGVVDKTINGGSNYVTHNFGTLNISGEIILKGPGTNSETVDLLKDASFKRDITRIIQVELEKNKNGGKNKG
jgi:hypothetical protein